MGSEQYRPLPPKTRPKTGGQPQQTMRNLTLISTLAVALFAADTLEAQRRGGGRNRTRRTEEITNRVGVFFTETDAPKTDGDKVADLNTIDLVRAAASANQVTMLYLHDGEAEQSVVRQFESILFRADKTGDVLGIKLRMFHCGQIDISKEPAMKARYGKDAPLFIAFDKTGKELPKVSMRGYKAKASALEGLADKASSGAFKPSLKTTAKKYAKIVEGLEEALKDKKDAEQDATKAENKADRQKAEKQIAAAQKKEDKLLEAEEKLLAKIRQPERGSRKIGGRNTRRGAQGNTGRGNTGRGKTGGK